MSCLFWARVCNVALIAWKQSSVKGWSPANSVLYMPLVQCAVAAPKFGRTLVRLPASDALRPQSGAFINARNRCSERLPFALL